MKSRYDLVPSGIEETGCTEVIANLAFILSDTQERILVLKGWIVTVSKSVSIQEKGLLERLSLHGSCQEQRCKDNKVLSHSLFV